MAKVADESGKSFDPRIVKILQERYVELEKLAHEKDDTRPPKLSVDVKVERGSAPAAGFERNDEAAGNAAVGNSEDFLASMAAARREAQILFELSHDLGRSLRLDDVLSLFAVRLRRLVAYDAMAVYVRHGKELKAEYASGDNFRLFSALRIPVGEGLSGWVAHNSKPIVNGNPSVEPGYVNDPARFSTLRSALAVPLQNDSEVVAVLALYRAAQDARANRYLFSFEAGWITRSIPLFVMRMDNGHNRIRESHLFQNFRPNNGVDFHLLEFFQREFSRLRNNMLRHRELADVVQQGRGLQRFCFFMT